MSDYLKGNFETKNEVIVEDKPPSLEERFEREALKRLGGSIAFVAKQKVLWGDEPAPEGAPSDEDGPAAK